MAIRGWSVALFVLALFTIYWSIGYIVPPSASTLVGMAEFLGAALVALTLVMTPYGRAAFRIFGFRSVDWRYVLAGTVGALVLSYTVEFVARESEWLQEVQQAIRMPMQLPASLLLIGCLYPLAEELAFRGLLFGWLEGRWGGRVAFVASSIAFAAAHWEPANIMRALLPGLLFGWLRWRSNSIVPSLVAHTINEVTAVLAAKYLV
jgi:membrane protease YdiL (CAAX protease family)